MSYERRGMGQLTAISAARCSEVPDGRLIRDAGMPRSGCVDTGSPPSYVGRSMPIYSWCCPPTEQEIANEKSMQAMLDKISQPVPQPPTAEESLAYLCRSHGGAAERHQQCTGTARTVDGALSARGCRFVRNDPTPPGVSAQCWMSTWCCPIPGQEPPAPGVVVPQPGVIDQPARVQTAIDEARRSGPAATTYLKWGLGGAALGIVGAAVFSKDLKTGGLMGGIAGLGTMLALREGLLSIGQAAVRARAGGTS